MGIILHLLIVTSFFPGGIILYLIWFLDKPQLTNLLVNYTDSMSLTLLSDLPKFTYIFNRCNTCILIKIEDRQKLIAHPHQPESESMKSYHEEIQPVTVYLMNSGVENCWGTCGINHHQRREALLLQDLAYCKNLFLAYWRNL